MFNLPGAGELIVILIIALIVLGPDKLPDAVRKAGRFYGELRRMSSGFQAELRDALDEPMREIRSTTDLIKQPFTSDFDAPAPKRSATATEAPGAAELTPEDEAPPADEDAELEAPSGHEDLVQGDRPGLLPPPAGGLARPAPGAAPAPLPSPYEG